MADKALRRACCALCAAVTALNFTVQGRAFEDKKDEPAKAVRVIVELDDVPLMGSEEAVSMGMDYLDTEAAQIRKQEISEDTDKALELMRTIYPETECEMRYDTLMCGFSAYLPKELMDDAESFSMIKSVTPVLNIETDMSDAVYQGGIADFSEITGLKGEGEVIAVIDSELDRSHNMFAELDDDVDVKLTEQDIRRALAERSLSRDIDPDKAYYNSKVPFAVNYTGDDMYKTENSELYHGTHVTGIAAGNRVYNSVSDTYVQGVAPDAQILFFGAFSKLDKDNKATASSDVVIAAMEDAVKLDADVINLSLGSRSFDLKGTEMYQNIINITEKLGIVVCCAAGNDGEEKSSPEEPDNGTIGEPASIGAVFSVASCDASMDYVHTFLTDEGKDVPFTECSEASIEAVFKNKPTDYVYCGDGAEDSFSDAEGRIALCEMGGTDFAQMAENAKKAGAVGLIVYSGRTDLSTDVLPACIISKRSGTALIDKTTGQVTFNGRYTKVPAPTSVSSFSSRGASDGLEIKPEISGIGSALMSASYDGFASLYGTSMATPYVAGCCALADSYLDSLGLEMKSDVRVQYIKNLLMASAVPAVNGELYESPRAQGAGLADLSRMMDDKVILTSQDNKAKLELGDELGKSFAFDVCVKNLSNEDVTFESAKLALTTDGTTTEKGREVTSGVEELSARVDIPDDMKTVAAWEEKVLTVSVDIDAEQYSELSQKFTNGFFAEGYLMLSGAENCCDISVPVMGFTGDWESIPVFCEDSISSGSETLSSYMMTNFYSYMIPASISLASLVEARDMLVSEDGSLERYKQAIYDASHQKYVVSRNSDLVGDDIGYRTTPMRNIAIDEINFTDAKGVSFGTKPDNKLLLKGQSSDVYYFDRRELPEGSYSCDITGHILRDGAENSPQKISFDFEVDCTPPVISDLKLTEKDGRKILTFTAQDKNLDGVFVIGNAGDGIASPKNIGAVDDVLGLFTETAEPTMSGEQKSSIFDCSYLDVIALHPDGDGKAKFSYDVTDLTEYTVSVSDRGYNTAEYSPGHPMIGKLDTPAPTKKGGIIDLKAPKVSSDTEITEQGWEISANGAEWKKFDPKTTMSAKLHNNFVRYYAISGGKRTYSNPVRISMESVPIMNIQVIRSGRVVSEFKTDSCVFDISSYGTGKTRIRATAEGYVTREYSVNIRDESDGEVVIELYKSGDVNGDGAINVTDIAIVAAHIKGIRALEAYSAVVGDINNDRTINVTDIALTAAHIKGVKAIEN